MGPLVALRTGTTLREKRLVDVVVQATGAKPEEIMLLRHSPAAIEKLTQLGKELGTANQEQIVEEYTCVQRVGHAYDFWAQGKPQKIQYVVVIVEDKVFAVYKVLGVELESTLHALSSEPFKRHLASRKREAAVNRDRGKKYQAWVLDWEREPARRFRIERVRCEVDGAPVKGWEGAERTTVLRSGSERFNRITVVLADPPRIGIDSPGEVSGQRNSGDTSGAQAPPVPSAGQPGPPVRQRLEVDRIIRDTEVTAKVKQLHDFQCQVCAIRLETPSGPYAEGAHIRPLGSPHDGPDTIGNVLCLCPNHHVLFDRGAFSVADGFGLLGISGELRRVADHQVEPGFLAYHRETIWVKPAKDAACTIPR